MTDQPNTETDAEFVERCEQEHDEYVGVNPSADNPEYRRLISIARRAVAPAPAGDVEQRVVDHELESYFYRHSGEKTTLLSRAMLDLRDARSALFAMPSGCQRGLLEAADTLQAGLQYVADCFEAARIEGLGERLLDDYAEAVRIAEDNRDRSIWGLVERRLMGVEIYVRSSLAHAAAQLGEPDDGWLPIASAPKDDKRVLLSCPHNNTVVIGRVRSNNYDEGLAWTTDAGESVRFNYDEPTRWRPLPSPPEISR